jgi:RNA polymerase sigma-70 factor (ECF subfamily)
MNVTPISEPPREDDVLVRVRARVLGYAQKRLSREAAEDVAQETLLLLVTKYAHVRDAHEQVRIAFGIVSRKTSSHWRKSRRRGEDSAVDVADVPLEDGRPDPEEQATKQRLLERLRTAISGLTGRCREVARLRLEDRTSLEIAEILGAKPNTVYSWEFRCLKKLRELMGAQEVRK